MAFHLRSTDEVEKLKLSEIKYSFEAENKVKEMLDGSALTAVALKDKLTTLEADNIRSFRVSADSKTLYYTTLKEAEAEDGESTADERSSNEDVTDLYKVSVDKKVGEAEKVESDIYAYSYYSYANGDLVYFKDVENSTGTLYVNGEKVEKDVRVDSIRRNINDDFYFLSDVDSNEGTLNLYNGKKVSEIADDVLAAIAVTPDGGVLYLVDYNMEKLEGELYYSKNGKEGKLLDEDVTFVLKPYMNTDL